MLVIFRDSKKYSGKYLKTTYFKNINAYFKNSENILVSKNGVEKLLFIYGINKSCSKRFSIREYLEERHNLQAYKNGFLRKTKTNPLM